MSLAVRAWRALLAGLITLFVLNIGLMIAAVITHSFARRWLGTWLPDGYTTGWYVSAWKEFQLDAVLWVTVEVVGAVVILSIVLGVPAAYALARRDFIGKRALLLLFLLPLLVPPITYGIPLATVMYQVQLAGTLPGVILANLVPALPFVILVMTPFIEQIDPNLESAARVLGPCERGKCATRVDLSGRCDRLDSRRATDVRSQVILAVGHRIHARVGRSGVQADSQREVLR